MICSYIVLIVYIVTTRYDISRTVTRLDHSDIRKVSVSMDKRINFTKQSNYPLATRHYRETMLVRHSARLCALYI